MAGAPDCLGARQLAGVHTDGFGRTDQVNITKPREKKAPRAVPGCHGDPDLRAREPLAKRLRRNESAPVDAVVAADEVVAIAHVHSPSGLGHTGRSGRQTTGAKRFNHLLNTWSG